MIGHSMGEVTAAVVAGALSPADGLAVIATRSRLMSRLAGQGAMALLELDPEATAALIADYPDVTLAVYASPRQTVIAGPPAAGRCRDRGGGRPGPVGAAHRGRCGLPPSASIDPILPELRSGAGGFDTADRRPSRSLPPPTTTPPAAQPLSMPSIGWPTCATRCGSARPSPPPAPSTPPSSRSARTRCSPTPSPTPWPTVHHHSIGTLQRDTHDTLTFHTNLNATHTTQPPHTEHPPEPHPLLPTTPWHHTHHWVSGHLGRSGGSAPLARDRCHGSDERHPGVGKHARSGFSVAR